MGFSSLFDQNGDNECSKDVWENDKKIKTIYSQNLSQFLES